MNYINISDCPKCKEIVPVGVNTMTHEISGLKVDILSCCVCDTVLNMDKDVEPEIVKETWLQDNGYIKEQDNGYIKEEVSA